jgi:hypothetical protein
VHWIVILSYYEGGTPADWNKNQPRGNATWSRKYVGHDKDWRETNESRNYLA